jgi:hypothetical protein
MNEGAPMAFRVLGVQSPLQNHHDRTASNGDAECCHFNVCYDVAEITDLQSKMMLFEWLGKWSLKFDEWLDIAIVQP